MMLSPDICRAEGKMRVEKVNSQAQESSGFCDEQTGVEQKLGSLQAMFQYCMVLSIISKDE